MYDRQTPALIAYRHTNRVVNGSNC